MNQFECHTTTSNTILPKQSSYFNLPLPPMPPPLPFPSTSIAQLPVPHAKALSVKANSDLHFWPRIQLIFKSCQLHLHNISKFYLLLTIDFNKLLIHSHLISRLNYCNSLIIGLPLHLMFLLQPIISTDAKLVNLTSHSVFLALLCQSLHLLPLAQ